MTAEQENGDSLLLKDSIHQSIYIEPSLKTNKH